MDAGNLPYIGPGACKDNKAEIGAARRDESAGNMGKEGPRKDNACTEVTASSTGAGA